MTDKITIITEELYKDSENIHQFSLKYREYLEGKVEEKDLFSAYNKYRKNKAEILGGA